MIRENTGDLFADTYFFLALLSKDSEDHARAAQATVRRRGRLITTAWVLLETANALAPVRSRGAFPALLAMLRNDPGTVVVPPDIDTFDEGVRLYDRRPDKAWSLTDCISFVVMRREGLTDALTADHHFTQAGFNAVLAETGA